VIEIAFTVDKEVLRIVPSSFGKPPTREEKCSLIQFRVRAMEGGCPETATNRRRFMRLCLAHLSHRSMKKQDHSVKNFRD
jgi:hypothetical protein